LPCNRIGLRKRAESYGEDVVKLDCYAVLGLSPAADDVVIRAAYLALMRRYHPDRNGSAEAGTRARAITEAYETIGDPARRAEYDASLRAHQFVILGYDDEPEPAPRLWRKASVIPWPKAPVIGAVAASALAIVLAVTVLPLTRSGGEKTVLPPTRESSTEQPVSTELVAGTPGTTEEKRPSQLVASISSRPEDTSRSPAPTAPTLPEKLLATRPEPAQAIANTPLPAKVDVSSKLKRIDVSSPPASARPAPPKAAQVDEKARIAALEGMSTSFYIQSVNHADDARRSQLQQARDLFANSRAACRTDSCVGDAHASYIRDISRIMQKPKQTNP
jgi:curved DNA-binding protein CbpA